LSLMMVVMAIIGLFVVPEAAGREWRVLGIFGALLVLLAFAYRAMSRARAKELSPVVRQGETSADAVPQTLPNQESTQHAPAVDAATASDWSAIPPKHVQIGDNYGRLSDKTVRALLARIQHGPRPLAFAVEIVSAGAAAGSTHIDLAAIERLLRQQGVTVRFLRNRNGAAWGESCPISDADEICVAWSGFSEYRFIRVTPASAASVPQQVQTEADVQRLLLAGERLTAMQLYRKLHSVDLKTAQKAIDRMASESGRTSG
jgi:Na+-transporting methylmalonyl-CoA/oxaloacetate decarboxylase gamma subunit